MNWTRMKDWKGGYYAVAQCCGDKLGVRVWHLPGRTCTGKCPYPWQVEVGGEVVDAKRTCKEAKETATRLANQWRYKVWKEKGCESVP